MLSLCLMIHSKKPDILIGTKYIPTFSLSSVVINVRLWMPDTISFVSSSPIPMMMMMMMTTTTTRGDDHQSVFPTTHTLTHTLLQCYIWRSGCANEISWENGDKSPIPGIYRQFCTLKKTSLWKHLFLLLLSLRRLAVEKHTQHQSFKYLRYHLLLDHYKYHHTR